MLRKSGFQKKSYPCQELAAALLAGGVSRRMGTDKAMLALAGRPMAVRLVERLQEVCEEVFLACGDPERYRCLGIPAVPDRFPGCGPLAGLHAALLYSRKPRVLVLACDLACVSARLLDRMSRYSTDADAVVTETSDGRLHPTCAVYSRTCLPAVARALDAGSYKMLNLLQEPDLRVLRFSLDEEGFSDRELLDINTPADLEDYLRRPKP